MTLFYLSFATTRGCLGATVVKAKNERDAVAEATRRKLNPGGEIAIWQVPPEAESLPHCQAMLNRLVGKEELLAGGNKRLGDLGADDLEVANATASMVCEAHNRPARKRR